MTIVRKSIVGRKGRRLAVAVSLLAMCWGFRSMVAQERLKARAREVPFRIVSAEVTRFEKPIRIGPPKRAIEYREALVLKLRVDRERFDSLPPDIEPFLYVGPNEYRIFHIDRHDKRKHLVLTCHLRNWEKLTDRSPMVLTIDHGAPIRSPKDFDRAGIPRYRKKMIVDKR